MPFPVHCELIPHNMVAMKDLFSVSMAIADKDPTFLLGQLAYSSV